MPFDGDPKKYETKPDVFSMESFVLWLESQPRRGRYTYFITERCLLTQWLNSLGIYPQRSRDYPPEISAYCGPFARVAVGYPQTYSGALKRARKELLASR